MLALLVYNAVVLVKAALLIYTTETLWESHGKVLELNWQINPETRRCPFCLTCHHFSCGGFLLSQVKIFNKTDKSSDPSPINPC